jgi:hypothetical protein
VKSVGYSSCLVCGTRSGSGSISLDEFFSFFKGMKASPFGRRMFTIFDVDKSGEIDFKEFVMSVGCRCALPANIWLRDVLFCHGLGAYGMFAPPTMWNSPGSRFDWWVVSGNALFGVVDLSSSSLCGVV